MNQLDNKFIAIDNTENIIIIFSIVSNKLFYVIIYYNNHKIKKGTFIILY